MEAEGTHGDGDGRVQLTGHSGGPLHSGPLRREGGACSKTPWMDGWMDASVTAAIRIAWILLGSTRARQAVPLQLMHARRVYLGRSED